MEWGVEREKLNVKLDYIAASDFSPGILDRFSTLEVLEREKEKVERD